LINAGAHIGISQSNPVKRDPKVKPFLCDQGALDLGRLQRFVPKETPVQVNLPFGLVLPHCGQDVQGIFGSVGMHSITRGSAAVFNVIESLNKLERLDIATVYPGHGSQFADVERALRQTKDKLRAYLADRKMLRKDLLKKIIIHTLLMTVVFGANAS
jgi:hypothetical protein